MGGSAGRRDAWEGQKGKVKCRLGSVKYARNRRGVHTTLGDWMRDWGVQKETRGWRHKERNKDRKANVLGVCSRPTRKETGSGR